MIVEIEDGVELMPCPLCGSAPILRCDGLIVGVIKNNKTVVANHYWAKCSNVECAITPRASKTQELAAEKWNSRT